VLNDVDMSQSQTDTRSMKIDEPKQSVTPDVEEILRLHAEFLNTDGASGQCADLSGADLGDTDLSGRDLSAANLSGAKLAGARLIRCKMNMTIATGADLSGADLAAADLRGINLGRAKLVEANLRRANLTGLELKDKNGQKTGKIWRSDLSSADFSGANLVDARLKSAKLDGAKFTGAHLAGTDFTGCVLAKADLTGAELDGAIIEADENTECHRILCEIAMIQRDYDRATLHNDKALALNPNDPRIVAQKGELLTWTGDPEAAVEVIEQALALDPFGQEERIHLLGFALYTLGRYQEAADAFKRITDPKVTHLAFLAASRAELGDDGAASAHSAKILRMNPEFAIASHIESIPYQDPSHRERYRAGLRKAGLPE
ncbi:MAG: pentapeptide repeat-containing protein, partial [Alphaproteobacteria bacterium]|nr:pentapeptide repeat-containing protein [Alphaproteobacteria bacterium]